MTILLWELLAHPFGLNSVAIATGFFGQSFNWEDGEQFCQESVPPPLFAHLVSIHSEAENEFVRRLWRQSLPDPAATGALWIGLNDKVSEDTWEWTDGTTADYFNWYSGEPSGDGDCAIQWKRNQASNGEEWNDRPCTYESPVICKVPAY